MFATFAVSTSIMLFTLSTLVPSASAQFVTVDYHKIIYFDGILPNAGIEAGGVLQTWGGLSTTHSKHNIKGNINVDYPHAVPIALGPVKINKGFPIQATGSNVGDPTHIPPIPGGYNSGLIRIGPDDHTNPNSANALIVVGMLTPNGPAIRVQGQADPHQLSNSVEIHLEGHATAGIPIDGDNHHSADSIVAASITGANHFFQATIGPAPVFTEYTQIVALAGADADASAKNGTTDPAFFTLTDLTTGLVTIEPTMIQTIIAENALFAIDDSGIRLTVRNGDPTSYANLAFSSAISSWVLNPYTYGARLDASGLDAYGETPLSGWSITTTASTVEAFFAFGPGGQPFDVVRIQPDSSLLTPGHSYLYGSGSDIGAYVVVSSVPEPSTYATLGSGILGALSYARRRRKVRS
jgi:hypothetical protein